MSLLPNPIDERDAWLDMVVSGTEEQIPKEYLIKGLKFEPQGTLPFCAAFSLTKLVETKDDYEFEFSQPDNFFKSGGSKYGTYFRAVLEAARKEGLVDYEALPMPDDIWSLDEFEDLKGASAKIDGVYRIDGYARVPNDSESIKRAIMKYGPLLAGVSAKGGYWSRNYVRKDKRDNHAVLLVGWDLDGWEVFDSLQPHKDFKGYHHISDKNDFFNVWAVLRLPKTWKKKQEKKQYEEFEYCLNHYGMPRNFTAEKEAAKKLEKEFKKFKNHSVWEAAGRFWTVYVNAVVYGGYNISYRKWGIWKPGDVINDCYNWRRTGEHIFDLNKKRSEFN